MFNTLFPLKFFLNCSTNKGNAKYWVTEDIRIFRVRKRYLNKLAKTKRNPQFFTYMQQSKSDDTNMKYLEDSDNKEKSMWNVVFKKYKKMKE